MNAAFDIDSKINGSCITSSAYAAYSAKLGPGDFMSFLPGSETLREAVVGFGAAVGDVPFCPVSLGRRFGVGA